MKAAIVSQAGKTPALGDFPEPAAGPGEMLVHVKAAAISQVVKSRASGTHYSSSGRFPFVVGVDGVGRLEDGSRVYFVAPKGSMAERAAVPSAYCAPVPDGS